MGTLLQVRLYTGNVYLELHYVMRHVEPVVPYL